MNQSYVVVPAILLLGLLIAAGYAIADRAVDRWMGRRLNDAALSEPLPDRSMRYVEREAHRG